MSCGYSLPTHKESGCFLPSEILPPWALKGWLAMAIASIPSSPSFLSINYLWQQDPDFLAKHYGNCSAHSLAWFLVLSSRGQQNLVFLLLRRWRLWSETACIFQRTRLEWASEAESRVHPSSGIWGRHQLFWQQVLTFSPSLNLNILVNSLNAAEDS